MAIVAATLTAAESPPPHAFADHPVSLTPPLPVVLAGSIADEMGRAIEAESGHGVPAIVRNPIAIGEKDPDGKPRRRIPVCSVPAYRRAVTAAVAVWNTGAGVPIFEMLTSSPAVTYDGMGKIDTVTSAGCPATAEPESGEDKYVASVVVLKNMEQC